MLNLERLLVATDFSECGAVALRRAAQCAEMLNSELTVAHSITNVRAAIAAMPPEARWELIAGDVDKFERELRSESDRRLEKLIAPLRKKKDRKIRALSLTGLAYVEIIHAVQTDKYGIVFVGHHGLTGLRRMLLGSTAERLVRHCPAPVWVAHAETPKPPKRILVAIDFSEASHEALRVAAVIAEKSRAELDVLHVLDDSFLPDATPLGSELAAQPRDELQRSAETKLQEWLQPYGSTVRSLVPRVAWGPAWKTIRKHARRTSADLIVVGSIGRSGVAGLLLGNIAEKIVRLADRDVLVVKPADFVSHIQPPTLSPRSSS